jgi:hypothetical protein
MTDSVNQGNSQVASPQILPRKSFEIKQIKVSCLGFTSGYIRVNDRTKAERGVQKNYGALTFTSQEGGRPTSFQIGSMVP